MVKRQAVNAILMFLGTVAAVLVALLLLRNDRMAIGLVVGGIGAFLVFSQPFIGLLNYLVFLFVRPQEFIPALSAAPVMLMIAAATSGVLVLHTILNRKPFHITKSPQNLLVIWFFLAILASHMSMVNFGGTVAAAEETITKIILYFLVAMLVDTERKFRVVLDLLLALTMVLAIQGIVQHYTGMGLGGATAFAGERIQGIGIFSDPNDLAVALIMPVPYVFLLLTDSRNLLIKALGLIALAILLYGIFLTQSRGALLSTGAIFIIFIARRFGLVPAITLGVLAFMAIFVVAPRMSQISTEEASAYGRILAWTTAFELIEYRPLFGVGYDMFVSYHSRTAHNSYLLCFSELGLFGIFPWVMLFFISIKNMHFITGDARPKRDTLALYSDSVMLGLIAFFAGTMFLSRTYSELLFIYFGLASAVTRMFVVKYPGVYKLVERRDFRHTAFAVVGLWLLHKVFLILSF